MSEPNVSDTNKLVAGTQSFAQTPSGNVDPLELTPERIDARAAEAEAAGSERFVPIADLIGALRAASPGPTGTAGEPSVEDVAAQLHAVLTGIDRWDLQSDKMKAKYRMAAAIVLRAAATALAAEGEPAGPTE